MTDLPAALATVETRPTNGRGWPTTHALSAATPITLGFATRRLEGANS